MKTVDISGMGGSYENECQKLLWNGIKIVESEPELAEKAFKQMRSYKNIYGVLDMAGPDAKEFEKKLTSGFDDLTGAMVHCVLGVLCYIAQNGKDKWLSVVEKDQPERIYDWDGTVKSCPETEISRKLDKEHRRDLQ